MTARSYMLAELQQCYPRRRAMQVLMAGDRQAPTGTAFDPWPQFWVHQYEASSSDLATMAGRCWFAPIAVGTEFSALALPGQHLSSATAPCRLRVEKISVYGRRADELDQNMSARLILSGTVPAALVPESILMSVGTREAVRWRRDGSLWIRGLHQINR